MKQLNERPMLVFSVCFAVGILGALQVNVFTWLKNSLYALVILCILATICFSVKRRRFLPLIVMAGLVAGSLWGTVYAERYAKPILKLQDRTAEISAVVTRYPTIYEENQRVEVKVEQISAGNYAPKTTFRTLIYLPLTEEPLRPGDRVTGSFSFYRTDLYDGFQSAEYYASKNYFILGKYIKDDDDPRQFCQIESIEKVSLWSAPLTWAVQLKSRLDERLDPHTAGLVKALLFGDKTGLSELDEQAMRKVGLSHVIAVSGMHIGFLVSFFSVCFSRRYGMLLSVFAIVLFVPMAGYTPSILRAAIMYIILAGGVYLRREEDSLTSMGFALFLLLVINPYSIYSLSLQLSFLATLGLLLFSEKLQKVLFDRSFGKMPKQRVVHAVGRAICSAVSCSLCAMLFTTPVLLSSFGYLSLLSPIANIATIFVFAILFILGMLVCVLPVIPFLTAATGMILTALCSYCFWVADIIGKLRFLLVYWAQPCVKIAIVVTYVLLVISIFRVRAFRYTIPAICVILIGIATLNVHEEQTQRRVTLLPSGSGQTIAISNGHRELVVVDCSGSGNRNAAQSMLRYMEWNGFSEIDLLVLTAVDKTHARNVPELLEMVPVKQLVIPAESKDSEIKSEIERAAQKRGIEICIWKSETEVSLDTMETPISLLGGISGKLGVRIGQKGKDDVLILHSLTQKMMDYMLTESPTITRNLVLSAGNLEDPALLARALLILSPEHIYLHSGGVAASRFDGIPASNTFEAGEICITYPIISTGEG